MSQNSRPDVEDMAKIIYRAMIEAARLGTPAEGRDFPTWMEGGNSTMQFKARSAARAILDLPQDVVSEHMEQSQMRIMDAIENDPPAPKFSTSQHTGDLYRRALRENEGLHRKAILNE